MRLCVSRGVSHAYAYSLVWRSCFYVSISRPFACWRSRFEELFSCFLRERGLVLFISIVRFYILAGGNGIFLNFIAGLFSYVWVGGGPSMNSSCRYAISFFFCCYAVAMLSFRRGLLHCARLLFVRAFSIPLEFNRGIFFFYVLISSCLFLAGTVVS